jgi:hypothetical protein
MRLHKLSHDLVKDEYWLAMLVKDNQFLIVHHRQGLSCDERLILISSLSRTRQIAIMVNIQYLLFEYDPLAYWPLLDNLPSIEEVRANLPEGIFDLFHTGALERSRSFLLHISAQRVIERIIEDDSSSHLIWILVLTSSTAPPDFLWELCHVILQSGISLLTSADLESLIPFMILLKVDVVRLNHVLNSVSQYAKKAPRFLCYYLERRQKVLTKGEEWLTREFFPMTQGQCDETQFNNEIMAWIISDHYQIVTSKALLTIDLDYLYRITKVFVELYQLYTGRPNFLSPNQLETAKYVLRRLRLQAKAMKDKCSLERRSLIKQQREAARKCFLAITKCSCQGLVVSLAA